MIGLMFFAFNSLTKIDELNTIKLSTNNLNVLSKMIYNLQQERGLTSGYLANEEEKSTNLLDTIRLKTNKSFDDLLQNLTQPIYIKKYKLLIEFRAKVNNSYISSYQAFDFYTKIIRTLQLKYLTLTQNIKDPYLIKLLQSYMNLSFMEESLGQIRGSINGILIQKTIDRDLLNRAILAKGLYITALERFKINTSENIRNHFNLIQNKDNYKYIINILNSYIKNNQKHTIQDNKIWFLKSTKIIDELYKLDQEHLYLINNYIQKTTNKVKLDILFDVLFFIVISIFIIWIGIKLKHDIIRNIRLLKEYKNAVDRSSIVSKTNTKGQITYVNDKFCSISGYSRDELLGQPHNIVRSQFVSKAVFKTMWNTILSKNPWSGVVKNKKKNGDFYTVEVTINPILNHNNEIEEFIAIRNDITDVIKLNEDIENTQKDLIFKMGELGETRSKETGLHVKRVSKYSEILAIHYGLNEEEIKYITLASPMHDIGKVGIPDSILNKPAKLTPEEFEIMKTHTTIGYNLFKNSDKPLLKAAAIISHEHHEKFDGTGYPQGLKGENIHIFARITAVADFFDALSTTRCYKDAWKDEDIFQLFKDESGKHFDPKLINIFCEHLEEFLDLRAKYKDID